MSVSLRDLDPAFQGAGQKAGIEIWRIQNFSPVLVPKSSHGKFFTGDSYIILKTTALKNGALNHDIHYWLGKDTSQDEAGSAAIKTVELDAALGSRAVQYREVQGHESERFLSYFKPCIIPQEGGVASGFKHVEPEEHQTRLYECKGKHVVNVKEVPFARSLLNHDDVFILDTKSKIFQFNGSNACIQERAKALEVVQYIKDTYHDGKCDIATIDDGKLMADADTGEFWGFFGGFAPLPKKTNADKPNGTNNDATSKLFCIEKGEAVPFETESWTRDLLETNKCYILDSGLDVFVWMGRGTSVEERKAASRTVDELLCSMNRTNSRIIRMVEGFEIVTFRTYFESWPKSANVAVSTDGRGKVAALLKRQGLNVKGLKEEPPREEPQPYIDCSGDLQVWRVNDREKILLQDSDQNKFYSGDCYIFQYSYSGGEREEYLIGTWFGKQSVEEDRVTASSLASKMVEALKFLPTWARIYEGHEPIQFFAVLQSFIVFKGGLSNGYKNYIAEKELPDDTYTEDGLAIFRIQGTGPENMQAIQVEPVASSLNSYYCYILHSGSSVFNWSGNLTTSEDQELVERQLDVIKPNMQSKFQKEGAECEQFWDLLGGKTEYSSEKISREAESDPHLFSCTLSKEVYNYNQDDLMTEDIFILDCHSDIYVWVGQQVDSKNKLNALNLGEEFLERDFLLSKLSKEAPIYVIMEGNEPAFFTRFFTWDPTKSSIHGNSFERKLAVLKHGGTSMLDKPRRRPVIFSGRSAAPEKSQRSRSVTFSPERARVRGRSPAFNALASTFENPNSRNLSTPPPMVKKLYPRSSSPDSVNPPSKSAAIAALSVGFQQPGPARQFVIPRSIRAGNEVPKPRFEGKMSRENSVEQLKSMPETIQEDMKEDEVEDDEGLPIYPFERLITSSTDPIEDIDVTKRETYLSVDEFKEKFGMTKSAFNKLPKWKQNKMKISLQLF
ncbi:Villin-4 [Striga hermonthica]|uniref:Villin-4 n=1 Tax=Striga hermonthica TaxID=68872 RepID=A0A9N7RM68_STRHE|nr:Villin-4 [Striga hermonthica]